MDDKWQKYPASATLTHLQLNCVKKNILKSIYLLLHIARCFLVDNVLMRTCLNMAGGVEVEVLELI